MNGQTVRQSVKDCSHCRMPFQRDNRSTWAYWEKAKYCSQACAGLAHKSRSEASRSPLAEEFVRWFSRDEGCWEWDGARDKDGYGIFSYAGKTSRAARVALSLDGREPGEGFACHHCDNPACVRPDHLFVGSNQDNMQDMVRKGRNPNRVGKSNPNWKTGAWERKAQ